MSESIMAAHGGCAFARSSAPAPGDMEEVFQIPAHPLFVLRREAEGKL